MPEALEGGPLRRVSDLEMIMSHIPEPAIYSSPVRNTDVACVL